MLGGLDEISTEMKWIKDFCGLYLEACFDVTHVIICNPKSSLQEKEAYNWVSSA